MARRKPTGRSVRHDRDRAQAEIVQDLERLARLAPGGAPERPLPVASPAQVEAAAARQPCPLCDGNMRLEEHTAETVAGVRLRVARVICTSCAMRRAVYFRIGAPLLN
ncbi:MAG: hypothetical protein U0807_13635 [Candidatus Binatia bacterium]